MSTRVRRILSVLSRHGLTKELGAEGLKRPLESEVRYSGERLSKARAEELRSAIEEVGGIFPTLGRLLSLRPDVLPASYIEEFSKLQERETAVPSKQAIAAIEHELG